MEPADEKDSEDNDHNKQNAEHISESTIKKFSVSIVLQRTFIIPRNKKKTHL